MTLPLLSGFRTVEQCSLDYRPERGSSIDPHIDDCWIWGERIPTLSLLSDSVLTLTQQRGQTRYNLPDVATYPSVVDDAGNAKTMEQIAGHYSLLAMKEKEDVGEEGKQQKENNAQEKKDGTGEAIKQDTIPATPLPLVRLPMPRRSLLVLYGCARYSYEHRILREDLPQRRVCVTYRELTPPFLEYGDKHQTGQQILDVAKTFWNHKEVYKYHQSVALS